MPWIVRPKTFSPLQGLKPSEGPVNGARESRRRRQPRHKCLGYLKSDKAKPLHFLVRRLAVVRFGR